MAKDFRKATDELFSVVSHQELADALGCSVATIRQARLGEGAAARRKAPAGWEEAVQKLADQKATHFSRLAAKMRAT